MSSTGDRRPQSILVGVDGSLTSRAALRWAVEHAHAEDVVVVTHVWTASPSMVDANLCDADDEGPARRLVEHEISHVRALADALGVHLAGEVLRGDAESVLCHSEADLLVVGACGRTRITGRLLGSVSYYLARHCHLPLVIVPLQGGAHTTETH